MLKGAVLKSLCTLPIRKANSAPHPKHTVHFHPKLIPLSKTQYVSLTALRPSGSKEELWQQDAKTMARKRVLMSTKPH